MTKIYKIQREILKNLLKIIPVLKGVHDESQETSEVQKTHTSDNFITSETAELRRSPRNHQNSTLPSNCFMAKIITGASGFTQEVIMT